MIKEMRDFILELVQSEYETGHQLAEDKIEFKQILNDEGVRFTNSMWDFYVECHDIGPSGFYAEYKDELDFDPMFVAEYGDEESGSGELPDGDDYRYAPYTDPDGPGFYSDEEDIPLDEDLSNKEKLKRAYPELNFDNHVTETLNESVDPEDKMKTAVGILFDMDNFVLSVYDNDYWLSMGVPDGEFSENDRDLAEANYKEHQWLIEDDNGEFDAEAFRDLFDAFETATDDSDYDQNERARIIHEAEAILNMNESIEDMDRRCEKCNTLLNDMGKCPRCDEGEEDLDEAVLNERSLDKTLDRIGTKEDKALTSRAKAVPKAIKGSINSNNTYLCGDEKLDANEYSQKVRKVVDILKDSSNLLKLSKNDANYKDVAAVIDTVVIDKDGWIIRRGLETIKPRQIRYRQDREDVLEIKKGFGSKDFLGASAIKDTNSPQKPTSQENPDNLKPQNQSDSNNQNQINNNGDSQEQTPNDQQERKSDTQQDQKPASDQSSKPSISEKGLKNVLTALAKRKTPIKTYFKKDGDKYVQVAASDINPENMSTIYLDNAGKNPLTTAVDQLKQRAAKNLEQSRKRVELFEDLDDSLAYDDLEDQELDEGLNKEEMKSLMQLAKQLGITTVGELQKFSENEVADNEDLLTAMKRYKGALDGDIEPLDETFSEDVINEEFTNYSEIKSKFEANGLNYGQREAFDVMFTKACRSLNVDPDSAIVYEDNDREFDPVYFADESKELQYNVLKLKVFDLEVVRIEFKGTVYIIFKSQSDADVYMTFAH